MNPRVLAYYLPQFHPTPENDKWWGKGFTEWTNVAKAKPLFRGHHQPHIPADLGFYDLRLPQPRIAQAEMARDFGIAAFCYWHYWFGKDRKLLNFPFEEVVRTGEPDFPFCLAWGNHTWEDKVWNAGTASYVYAKRNKILIAQEYGGEEDYIAHFNDLLEAFRDPRYLKVHDRLLFAIFDPDGFQDFPLFKQIWTDLAQQNGLNGFFFVAHDLRNFDKTDYYKSIGYDAVNLSLHRVPFEIRESKTRIGRIIDEHFSAGPNIVEYKKAIQMMDSPLYERADVFPTIIPNWDHTPRSGRFGRLFKNCTPELFAEHVRKTLDRLRNKPEEDQVVFLKSWNEWGEGNYLEPDLEYGTAFGEALRKEIKRSEMY